MRLEPMMTTTQRYQVVSRGRTIVGVRDDVVGVATPRRHVAPWEDAGQVALGGLVVEAVGDLVGPDVDPLAQVEDRLDRDLGVGVGAPVPDLVGGDDLLAALVGFGMVYNAVISFRALFLGMPDWAWFAMWVSPGAAFVGILLAGSELRGEPARSYLVAIALPLSMCIPAVLVWLARSPG